MAGTWKRANTDWFRDCGWGVFTHYLTKVETTADEWNRQVDAFDVQALANQLASVGAPYYFITLGQGSGHYCAPNATHDRIVGIKPSKCSKRDLVSDIYDALKPHGIKLLVYVPADGPWADKEARKPLKITTHWGDDPKFDWQGGPQWTKYRLPEFQRMWEDVCRDWSLRFGRKIGGWWVDGAYAREERYPDNEPPNFRTYAEALKAGNPDSLVAFNPGVKIPVICHSAYEDFTAGELSGDLPVGGWGLGDNPAFCGFGAIRRWVDGAQYHVLNFLGPFWCQSPPRFPTELVVGYTKYVRDHEGVVTWDVPIDKKGVIPAPFIEQLRAVKKAMEARK